MQGYPLHRYFFLENSFEACLYHVCFQVYETKGKFQIRCQQLCSCLNTGTAINSANRMQLKTAEFTSGAATWRIRQNNIVLRPTGAAT